MTVDAGERAALECGRVGEGVGVAGVMVRDGTAHQGLLRGQVVVQRANGGPVGVQRRVGVAAVVRARWGVQRVSAAAKELLGRTEGPACARFSPPTAVKQDKGEKDESDKHHSPEDAAQERAERGLRGIVVAWAGSVSIGVGL